MSVTRNSASCHQTRGTRNYKPEEAGISVNIIISTDDWGYLQMYSEQMRDYLRRCTEYARSTHAAVMTPSLRILFPVTGFMSRVYLYWATEFIDIKLCPRCPWTARWWNPSPHSIPDHTWEIPAGHMQVLKCRLGWSPYLID